MQHCKATLVSETKATVPWGSLTKKSNTCKFLNRYVDKRTGNRLSSANKRTPLIKERFAQYQVQEKEGPPLGRYEPGKTATIEYNNHFRGLSFEHVFDEFNPLLVRDNVFRMYKVRMKEKGPDMINFDKPVFYHQAYAPFSSTAKRFKGITRVNKEREETKAKIGPGKYDYSDCYRWIKKSYNIMYQ